MGRGMVERNQRIGLRVVGRSIADRRRICHHQKVFCPPFLQTALAVGPPDTRSTRSPAVKPNVSMSAGLMNTTRRPPFTPRYRSSSP